MNLIEAWRPLYSIYLSKQKCDLHQWDRNLSTIMTNREKQSQYFNMGNQPNLFDNESIKTLSHVTNANYIFNSNVYQDCIGTCEFNSQD